MTAKKKRARMTKQSRDCFVHYKNRRKKPMKYKRIIAAIAVAAGILALTACSSEKETSQNAGSLAGQSAQNSDAGSGSGSGQAANAGTAASSQADGNSAGSQSSGSSEDSLTGDQAEDSLGAAEEDVLSDVKEIAGEDSGRDAAASDIWSGTYTTGEETVTVRLSDANTISFSFAQSGISGTAEVNGTQAVFKGDDYHVVVFNMADGVLEVSVSSEEDYDTASSPLNGTYIPAH